MSKFDNIKWFHTMKLNGVTTKGLCDWRPYKHLFFLDNVKNSSVLDVGAGDGYFSFEMEKKGANVTATEIDSQLSRDNYNFGVENIKTTHSLSKGYNFKIARDILGSNIELIISNIYNLDKDINKKFDFVFCSDVIMHLTDPIRALKNIHTISNRYLILGNPIYYIPLRGLGLKTGMQNIFKKFIFQLFKNDPYIFYQGHTNRNIFWLPTIKGLEKIINSCGFKIIHKNIFFTKKDHHISPQKRIVILAEKI